MPLLQINLTIPCMPKVVLEQIHKLGAEILTEQIGKSIEYVMVLIRTGESISFALDTKTPAAYIEVKNVGEIGKGLSGAITEKITNLIHIKTGVATNRIYIEYQESERHHWGWDGKTFG
jgi:phenylpyruvate tautomerase